MQNKGRGRLGITKISNLLKKITAPMIKKKGFYHTKIISDWEEIIGQDLAEETRPMKITYTKKDSTLHLEVNNSSTAAQISYVEDVVLDKIASYLGYKAVTKIKLHQVQKTL